mmetsp:Transcript_51467/g.129124  ORF Transcript_51467/g.129124 Transcript_51467/m.129124 type:complete len:282 (+) Transcript_51467:484-1329(+)
MLQKQRVYRAGGVVYLHPLDLALVQEFEVPLVHLADVLILFPVVVSGAPQPATIADVLAHPSKRGCGPKVVPAREEHCIVGDVRAHPLARLHHLGGIVVVVEGGFPDKTQHARHHQGQERQHHHGAAKDTAAPPQLDECCGHNTSKAKIAEVHENDVRLQPGGVLDTHSEDEHHKKWDTPLEDTPVDQERTQEVQGDEHAQRIHSHGHGIVVPKVGPRWLEYGEAKGEALTRGEHRILGKGEEGGGEDEANPVKQVERIARPAGNVHQEKPGHNDDDCNEA